MGSGGKTMINMSYCRFNNTRLALDECLEAIQNGEKLSDPEMDSCKEMFRTFIDFCYASGIIDEENASNDKLEAFFETIGDSTYWN